MRERICVTVMCGALAKPGEIRCQHCRKDIVAKMNADGYLQPVPWQCYGNRTGEQMENIDETKNGINR